KYARGQLETGADLRAVGGRGRGEAQRVGLRGGYPAGKAVECRSPERERGQKSRAGRASFHAPPPCEGRMVSMERPEHVFNGDARRLLDGASSGCGAMQVRLCRFG